jgi:DNA-3-methyladenine glycosylase II
LAIEDQLFRDAGMSWSKIRYMKDLAQHVLDKKLDLLTLHTHSNEEIIRLLTQVKGIGPWTAEMFLMFTLGRPDVFSLGDLGLKRGIQKIYAVESDLSRQELLSYAQKWAPYRTFASRVLWKSLDNE